MQAANKLASRLTNVAVCIESGSLSRIYFLVWIDDAMKRLSVLLLAAFLCPLPLSAHAPELHRFKLVEFRRPFPAPDFALPDLQQQQRTLSSFRGKVVVLNFWATWCAPCVREMPALEKLQQRMQSRGLVVIGVATDTEGATQVAPFVRKLQLSFPILLDSENTVSQQYGARDLPATFLLDPAGKVIAAAKGAREWFSDEALSYLQEVLDAAQTTQRSTTQ